MKPIGWMAICCLIMNKTFTSRALLAFLFFGLGYLIAWFTLTPESRQAEDDSSSLKGSRSGPGNLQLRSNRSPGTSQSERRRLELAGHWENADMDSIIGKMDSIKTFEYNSYETGLSQELCDYLAISRSENTAIDEAIRSTAEQLKKLQASSIETSQIDDTTSKFVIKKFPAQGGDIKESLQMKIRETLGDNRSFLFSKIVRDSLAYTFLDYGETDVHITMKTSGPPGTRRYETLISSGTGSRRFETEAIPPDLLHLLQVE